MKAAPLSKKQEKSLCLLIVPILIDFAYFLSLKTKANPSPNGNGFAFNLFGDPFEVKDDLSISSKVTVFDLFL